MTYLTFEPLHPDFGAIVSGMDLTAPLSQEDVKAFNDAVDTYSVLLFRNQDMTDEKQLRLTKAIGDPEAEHVAYGRTGEVVYFGSVGNIDDQGNQRKEAHDTTKYQKGNELWHSDSSFRQVPSYVSILHAYEVPGEGGATSFVSERAAYDRLTAAEKDQIDNLRGLHDYVFSRAKRAPVDDNHAASLPPVAHPLVKTNPGNGRKNLFIGSHVRSILGLSGIDSRALINDLLEKTTRPEDVYSHQWAAGDTVVWDNRCVLHKGNGFDADKWRRRLRQTRVVGSEVGQIPA